MIVQMARIIEVNLFRHTPIVSAHGSGSIISTHFMQGTTLELLFFKVVIYPITILRSLSLTEAEMTHVIIVTDPFGYYIYIRTRHVRRDLRNNSLQRLAIRWNGY
jgi:hypothetical protein